ncbi:LOW QUALITY PROTEIN: RING-H2 finger protein ATL63-like [Populus alba x Populus x berolinensis]|nr:LOW QUALITY PROTEIN: RING-H2 finger protein ATL63-like [Populus alba x Populus x berolinensis]
MPSAVESPEHNPMSHLINSISSYDSNIMLAAVISLLLVILFVLLLHIYAKWFLAQARHRRRSSSVSVSHVLRASRFHHFHNFTVDTTFSTSPSKGLDRSVISSIPLFVYKAEECKQGLEAPAVGDDNDNAIDDLKSTEVSRESTDERGLSDVGPSRLEIVTDFSNSENENGNVVVNRDCLSESPSTSLSLSSSLKRMCRNRSESKVKKTQLNNLGLLRVSSKIGHTHSEENSSLIKELACTISACDPKVMCLAQGIAREES